MYGLCQVHLRAAGGRRPEIPARATGLRRETLVAVSSSLPSPKFPPGCGILRPILVRKALYAVEDAYGFGLRVLAAGLGSAARGEVSGA